MKIRFDIGFNRGAASEPFIENNEWMVFGFEPVPHIFEHAKRKYVHKDNLILIEKAVDVKEGSAVFHLANQSKGDQTISGSLNGAGSLLEFNVDNIKDVWLPQYREDVLPDEKVITVEKVRLDTVIEQYSIDKIDYLHSDAQGKDLEVLKSLGKYIDIVQAGQVEVPQFFSSSLYVGHHSLEETEQFLKDNGFKILEREDRQLEYNLKFSR